MTAAQTKAAESIKALTGRQHVHLTGRGAAGIFATLRASGFLGKDVLIPANTCYIVLWAVMASGNIPRLVDIDPVTGSVTPATVKAAYTAKTAAIIPCHLYGIPSPIDEICAWAAAHDIVVIEDAALAIGNQADGRACGAWGDVSILSFGLGKIIDIELGGAVLTDDVILSEEIERVLQTLPVWNTHFYRLTRNWNDLYGAMHRQEINEPSLNRQYAGFFQYFHEITAYRLPESYWEDLPYALEMLEQNLTHRRKLAALYVEHLSDLRVNLPKASSETALWKYPVFLKSDLREDVLDTLWGEGHYEVTCWYPSLQVMTSDLLPYTNQPPTPNADVWGADVINLPLSQHTTEMDAHKIIEALNHALEQF